MFAYLLKLLLAAPFLLSACQQVETQASADPQTCRQPGPAQPIPPGSPKNSTYFNSGAPPQRYQVDVNTKVEFVMDAAEVNRRCAGGVPVCGTRFFACRRGDTLIMPHPCKTPNQPYSTLLCHETAHVAGWPGTHGD